MQKELYFVWQEKDEYFNQYENLIDAVQEANGAEVFKAELKSLGSFELVTKVVKAKKGKK